jgi:hypothetical protein
MVERFKIDTFEFEAKKKFLFEVHFFNWNTQQNSVYLALGNLLFSHCETCTPFKTGIYLRGGSFYHEGDLAFNSDTKLSILRNGDIVSLYVNEKFVHAMEFAIIEGNVIKTNYFDTALGLNIRYLHE